MSTGLFSAIGHRFRNDRLIGEALTHRSAAQSGDAGYERLEFLGDRVVGLVVTDMLYAAFPHESEGALARRLAALVRRETLAEVAREAGLGQYIRLSRGEEDAGGRENDAILGDVCEAVIGAIYRDAGLDAARAFIERYWSKRIVQSDAPPRDPKTALQEWAQARGLSLPLYRVEARTGPDHAPRFTVSVTVAGHEPVAADGPSKRVAEQAAAAALLARVGG